MHGIARRVVMVVALLATMYGLLHKHAISAPYTDHAATAAQTCVLCVTAQSTLSAAPPRVAPPAAEELAEPAPRIGFTTRVAEESLSSRAPPRV